MQHRGSLEVVPRLVLMLHAEVAIDAAFPLVASECSVDSVEVYFPLVVWGHADGWCSTCGNGALRALRGEYKQNKTAPRQLR